VLTRRRQWALRTRTQSTSTKAAKVLALELSEWWNGGYVNTPVGVRRVFALAEERKDTQQQEQAAAGAQVVEAPTSSPAPPAQGNEDLIKKIHDLLDREHMDAALELFDRLHPSDKGEVLTALDPQPQQDLVEAIGPEDAAEILEHMDTDQAVELSENLQAQMLANILDEASPDVAADVLKGMSEPDSRRTLRGMWEAEQVTPLLQYADDTAGGRMTTRYLAVEQDSAIANVLMALRLHADEVEDETSLFVLDEEEKLAGEVSLLRLALSNPDDLVKLHMQPPPPSVMVDTDQEECARMMKRYNLSQLPVVNAQGRLVGVLLDEDLVDVLEEEATEDMYRMAGIGADESFYTPPLGSVRKRLPWMAMNVVLNLGAVSVISVFEGTIAQVAILAAFLPMITDMGGNVGIQSLSVAIRSIALGEVRISDFWKALRKEMLIGIANGIALGVLFGIIAILLRGNMFLGLIAGVALTINVFVAGVVGGTLPFIIKRFGRDPAMMTGPVLTTITDITGVSIFLGLSTVFLTVILR